MKDGLGRNLRDDAEFAELNGGPLVAVDHLWFGQLLSFIGDVQTSTHAQLKSRAHDVLMEVPQEVKDRWPGVFGELCTCGHMKVSHTGLENRCVRCKACDGFIGSAGYPEEDA
jgi:hypothetical protein